MKTPLGFIGPTLAGVLVALMAIYTITTRGVQAASTTHTTDSQFDSGILLNVNHNAPYNNQLQLNITGVGFPLLWVANAGEHTLSKIDTTQIGGSPGREVARYFTWFSNVPKSNNAWGSAAPSRTAAQLACDIDLDGDIDRNDIAKITAARGKTALPGDPLDLDGDGLITVNDARGCVLKCTRPNCAP